MPSRIRVGVACPIPGERAALLEWLDAAGYEPVPMLDVVAIGGAQDARSMELLIVDSRLASERDLPLLLKRLGPNRPVILVGDPGSTSIAVTRGDASWLNRPIAPKDLQLSVALALAEGRPSRRSPRKCIAPLPSSVDGVSAKLPDVSTEGVRFELTGTPSAALPPVFTIRVPSFGVVTSVKRVWVAQPADRSVWCGGTVLRTSTRADTAWAMLIDTAPVPGTSAIEKQFGH